MRKAIRTASLGLVLTAIALGVSPGLAQSLEEVKVVFEHAIPNIKGKRLVAQVVSYPPAGKSLPHHHAPSAFIYARVAARLATSPLKSTRSGKASTSCPARSTGSARMRVTEILRAYWLLSSSILTTIPWL
jgi:hypothetical protein